MSTEVPLPDRFVTNPEVQTLIDDAHEALVPFNSALAEETPMFDGTSLYGLDRYRVNHADTLVSIDAPGVAPNRLEFRKTTIDNHRFALGGTAVGATLKDFATSKKPQTHFASSLMNPDQHITWAHPLGSYENPDAAVQLAFSMEAEGDLPTNDRMDEIWNDYRDDIEKALASVQELHRRTDSLGDDLELLPPVRPNAFFIRWDAAGSTEQALSPKYGAYLKYIETWDQVMKALVKPHASEFTSEGDGHNIVLPLPKRIDPNDQTDIRVFGRHTVLPLAESLSTAHQAVAKLYPDLQPEIHLGVGLGYVEPDANGNLVSPEFWELGALTKKEERMGAQAILLTRRAQFLEKTA